MKRNQIILAICLLTVIILVYIGTFHYNNDDVRFNRYLDKVASVDRSDIKAFMVYLSQNNLILRSFNDVDTYLILELLQEIKTIEPEIDGNIDPNYTINIWCTFETSSSKLYGVTLEVDTTNYNFKINEINIDRNRNKMLNITRYFNANSKCSALLKEIINKI